MKFLKNRINSFIPAIHGLVWALINEPNIKIHFLSAICVAAIGFYTNTTTLEWIILLFCIGLVITAELINSAIEKVTDLYSREFSPEIKVIKDLSAAAVLIAAFISLLTGLIIFIPKFL